MLGITTGSNRFWRPVNVIVCVFVGWVIDTPGVRSFGLSHVSRDRIIAAFDDLAVITEDCPRGCSHEADAPECALDVAVERGELSPARLESFRRMLGSGQ